MRSRLKDSACRVLSEGLKVVTPENVHYPDVTVFCTPIQPTDDQIHEPVVIVEVLSRSTGDRDRGAKWVGYRALRSLQHYVLIAQDRRRVEVYTRSDEGWTLRLFEPPARQRAAAGREARAGPRPDLRGQRLLSRRRPGRNPRAACQPSRPP